MKHKNTTILLIVCIVLAAALLLSVCALISAGTEISALEEQVHSQSEYILALEQQLDGQIIFADEEDPNYGTLALDSWFAADGKLTVSGYVYIGMFSDTLTSAHLELRNGNVILQSIPLSPEVGEAEDVYECGFEDVSFAVPTLGSADELQLWLVAESANGFSFSYFGAGWYPEGDQLMLITG